MARKTPVDKLNDAIAKILKDYEGEIRENLAEVTVAVGKKGVTALRASSKQAYPKSQEYHKQWRYTVNNERLSTSVTIYNERPGLPHLLENGHLLRNGKRLAGKPHIAPVAEDLQQTFETEVLKKL